VKGKQGEALVAAVLAVAKGSVSVVERFKDGKLNDGQNGQPVMQGFGGSGLEGRSWRTRGARPHIKISLLAAAPLLSPLVRIPRREKLACPEDKICGAGWREHRRQRRDPFLIQTQLLHRSNEFCWHKSAFQLDITARLKQL
jgi:hypothetical protein